MGEKVEGAKNKGEKKAADAGKKVDGGPALLVFMIDRFCECKWHSDQIKKAVKDFNFPGVEQVETDAGANKLTVTGKVDAAAVKARLEEKINYKVDLVSPQPAKKEGGGGGGGHKKKIDCAGAKKDDKKAAARGGENKDGGGDKKEEQKEGKKEAAPGGEKTEKKEEKKEAAGGGEGSGQNDTYFFYFLFFLYFLFFIFLVSWGRKAPTQGRSQNYTFTFEYFGFKFEFTIN